MSSRFASPFPSIPLEPCQQSLYAFTLEREAMRDPDQTCYIDASTGEVVTRAEHWKRVLYYAAALRNLEAAGLLDLKKGTTALVFSPNSVLYPALIYAFVCLPIHSQCHVDVGTHTAD